MHTTILNGTKVEGAMQVLEYAKARFSVSSCYLHLSDHLGTNNTRPRVLQLKQSIKVINFQ